jgi:zinc resistance-associated protein
MNQRKEVKSVRGRTIIGILVVMVVLLVGTLYAFGYRGPSGTNVCQNLDIEKVKQFQKETMSLRDELITKKLELRKERSQQEPDTDLITTLRQEIKGIKAKIQEVAGRYDLPLKCMRQHKRAQRCMGDDPKAEDKGVAGQ